jgi:8-hydroxy-5-deazaflavin:NADPH oxidoreductase
LIPPLRRERLAEGNLQFFIRERYIKVDTTIKRFTSMRRSTRLNMVRHRLVRILTMTAVLLGHGSLLNDVFAQASKSSGTKIGIIGSGNIGSTVGRLWVKAGHQVLFSSRNPENLKELVHRLGSSARAGTVRDALTFGDAALIAVPYGAYPQVGKDYAQELAGKIVLDAGNAVPSRDGEISKEAGELGIGLTSAKYLPKARIVRAFNTLSYLVLANNAHRAGERMAIPIAGDDKEALAMASKLIQDAGFDPVIIGSLESARLFARGGPLYGQQITAREMRLRLKTLQ